MTPRARKVASLVHQIVAAELAQETARPEITVTGVDVSPDLRQATVWLDVLTGSEQEKQAMFEQAEEVRPDVQAAVASQLTTKFIPRLTFRLDASGEYAEKMNRLIQGL